MISSHSSNGRVNDAYKMFGEMRLQGFSGDGFTFSTLLTSCSSSGSLSLGQQTHGLVVTMGLLHVDLVVDSSLVNMYAKCGAIHSARKMFDEMPVGNVVSWNTIIVGYGHCGHGEEAVKLLPKMIRGISKPDELTVSAVLSSCATLAASIESKQIHGFALKNGLHAFISVGNALIISYAKSGSISDAYKCFCSVSEPNLITWSSMIRSFAFHGFSSKAVNLFEKMLRGGRKPDSIVFLGVLSACGHAGLVETGLAYFESMVKEYQINPCPEHYACIVDLLARAGNVNGAYNVLSQMPFQANADVLGAFLGGCRVHGEAAMAEWAAAKLFKVEPGEPVNYKSLSGVYASCRIWEGAASVRRTMGERCGKKVAGCCWVEINGGLHTFVANDESHPEVLGIYSTLKRLMKMITY
ncbi:putative pentatricopeptide repeat-containing protein [Platanthera guangdongensis]|uniref:Pentatricopeptide repeat-containing protein n=1 Tax=Platanthera guangdongensis TaxID=2320717 RepID=A0ABR2M247_9ASPA